MTGTERRSPDEELIRSLIGRAALIADDGRVDEYGTIYSSDAEWDLPEAPRSGLAAISEGARQRRSAGTAGPGSNTRHLVTVHDLIVEGDRARATSVWQFFERTTTAPALVRMGCYHDHLRRTSEGWRIVRRTITEG